MMHRFAAILLVAFFFLPTTSAAVVIITEIMYDLEGSDENREWVEILNDGSENVDLTGWKFDDGATSKHGLNAPPKNGGRGAMTLPLGAYAILADDATRFITEHPEYSGTVIDTIVELANTSDTVALLDGNGAVVDSVTYSSDLGAKGDGFSLQKNGNAFAAALPTPGSVSSSGGSSAQPPSATSTPSANVTTSSWPVEPQVFADAGPDRTAVVGADILFEAKALGLEKKPLENARFSWNFGDGSTALGARAFHAYRYPGVYVVVLDVASGYFSGSDRLRVTVEEPRISLRHIEKEGAGFVEVANASIYELDLSLWSLEEGTSTWSVPERTFVLPGKAVVFPDDVTGMRGKAALALLYPNGMPAASSEKAKPVAVTLMPPASSRSNQTAAAAVTTEAADTRPQAASLGGERLPWVNPWYLGLAGILASGLFGLWLVRKPPGLS